MNEASVADELRGTLAERLLVYISDQGGHAQRDELEKLADGDQWATADAVQMLESRGLAQNSSLAGDVKVMPAGQRVADKIRLLRAGQWRFEDLQRAALTWLYRQDEGAVPGLDGFLDAPEAADFEPPVTMQELQDVIELLDESGHVKPIRVAELGAVLAMITPKGRVALQSGLPISQQGGSNHTTYDNRNTVNFGDQAQVAAVMAGGHHNVQSVEQTIGPALRSELAEQVASLIKQAEELPDDMHGVLQGREELDEISKEIAKSDAKPSALQRLAYKALGTFAVAAATSGGQHIIQGLGHIVKLLEHNRPS